jgi:hypothetical protein
MTRRGCLLPLDPEGSIMITSYVWSYDDWEGIFPSLSGDEYYRRTLVLPNPFRVNEVDKGDGAKYRSALILVIAPWWATLSVFSATYRSETRAARAQMRTFIAEQDALDAAKF